MRIDPEILRMLKLLEEGVLLKDYANDMGLSYQVCKNRHNGYKKLYEVMKNEKDNPDHIIHLDITPGLYSILSRSNIYSIKAVKKIISENDTNNIRGLGRITLGKIKDAVIKYESDLYELEIEMIEGVINRSQRIIKFKLNYLDISDKYGMMEYDINTKEYKIYLELEDISNNLAEKIKNAIINGYMI